VVREVEPETARSDERPGLPRVIAQHVPQRPVDDVRRGVGPGGRLATRSVDLAVDLLALEDLAGPDEPVWTMMSPGPNCVSVTVIVPPGARITPRSPT
jgi:hypothetical protein